MTREAFGSSMFELADIWTENIGEEEVGRQVEAAAVAVAGDNGGRGGGGRARTCLRHIKAGPARIHIVFDQSRISNKEKAICFVLGGRGGGGGVYLFPDE